MSTKIDHKMVTGTCPQAGLQTGVKGHNISESTLPGSPSTYLGPSNGSAL